MVCSSVCFLGQVLASDPLGTYFSKPARQASNTFYLELLRCHFRSHAAPPKVFCLANMAAAAFVTHFPRDSSSPWALLVLRLMPATRVARWPALASYLKSIEQVRYAFAKAHGPFMHIVAVGPLREATGLLEAVCRAADDAQQVLYVEARQDQRMWLRACGCGFEDVMLFRCPGQGGPLLHIMARGPTFAT
jgi:hypothetical protein